MARNEFPGEQYKGKTLVLSWDTHHEWRVLMSDSSGNVSQALYNAINQAGITNGQPGIIPESIDVRVED